ncbi:soluble lytic murein transglycosylase [Keratinibaculum paraultunense]|uniref:Soluble lytic murein transglycosylase n=1 Tax=Keratinibaculum paraultunense TaxID=1278232 RepID=A0A4R3KZL4_9FIRM|nr:MULTISPECIES: lytic transglycosylase domain-containing protein [Bacillota]QQY80409.1 lytic transglycosylase domain-containing protein [Keratinibaculum paraultunense]TCS91122.1 soluble lytic murein transglycosylase [Keratinibaculum paraultunense]
MIWKGKLFKNVLIFLTIFFSMLLIINLYFNISYPLSYKNIIRKYSKQFDVDPYLVAAIINVESNFNKDAISSKDARGLMQISPTTGKWASEVLTIENFTLDRLFEPDVNIMIGTWYINMLSKEFNNDLYLVLAAYNGGSGNVSKWLEDKKYCDDGENLRKIPFKETEQYVEKVIKNYEIYKKLYDGQFENLNDDNSSLLIILFHNIKKLIKAFIIYK